MSLRREINAYIPALGLMRLIRRHQYAHQMVDMNITHRRVKAGVKAIGQYMIVKAPRTLKFETHVIQDR